MELFDQISGCLTDEGCRLWPTASWTSFPAWRPPSISPSAMPAWTVTRPFWPAR